MAANMQIWLKDLPNSTQKSTKFGARVMKGLAWLESYSAGHADLVTKVKNLSNRLDQILGKQEHIHVLNHNIVGEGTQYIYLKKEYFLSHFFYVFSSKNDSLS